MTPRLTILLPHFLLGSCAIALASLDINGNGLSDVWEETYQTQSLSAAADTDGDGYSNASEALWGTDPRSLLSRPEISVSPLPPAKVRVSFPTTAGKNYQLLAAANVSGPWQPLQIVRGSGALLAYDEDIAAFSRRFFKTTVADMDSDADGLTDAEEEMLGFNAFSAHTDRYDTADFTRVDAAWNAASTVTAGLIDGEMSERWPDPGVIAIRRSGGMKPLTVNFAIGGSAVRGSDYTMPAGNSITIPAGSREVWIAFTPLADADDGEAAETIILTISPGTGYTVGAPSSATATLRNEPAGGPPSAKSAARFLVQAAFGPDQDDPNDADFTPENVEQMMQSGYAAWIDQQMAIQPPGYLEPFVEHAGEISEFYTDAKEAAWWNRAMGADRLYYRSAPLTNGPVQPHDPLRQRVAFALSQILVVSDRPERLAVEYRALANYYDLFVRHAFGNYRDLLFDVTMHPVMGFYLSALHNQKADPANNIYPDENYAREVMQLFSIGLWELNVDGTRKVNGAGAPIPTYTNFHITQFARVFTGLGTPGGPQFDSYVNNWLQPMKLWDQHHDMEPKTLLNGLVTPQRTASSPDTGAAALADINDAIDNLFQHPNVGPFLGRQLIQRFVTSNPSPAYVGRVAAAFNNNGQGVRGDLKAVIRQVLLDPDARDPGKLADPAWGKLREPFLKFANFARAFNAKTQDGFYSLDAFYLDHQQEPLKSPSVFNFFLPAYSPPGTIVQAGLVAPEFQIINASSAIAAPNHYYNALSSRDLHRWGTGLSSRAARPDLVQEESLAQTDVDALLRKLDLSLTCGNLQPREFQIIRDAVLRISSAQWEYQKERVNLAVYLIVTSPEFAVLR